MSTKYILVDQERKQFLNGMSAYLKDLEATCIDRIDEFNRSSPLVDELTAQLLEDIGTDFLSSKLPPTTEEQLVIGTFANGNFRFTDNFQSLKEVRAYLTEHPSCCIEDEYQEVFSLTKFQSACSLR